MGGGRQARNLHSPCMLDIVRNKKLRSEIYQMLIPKTKIISKKYYSSTTNTVAFTTFLKNGLKCKFVTLFWLPLF
jgi:hypothetical protein